MGQGVGGGAPKKFTEEFGDKLADKFIKWCKNTENLFAQNFFTDNDLYAQQSVKLCECSMKFNLAYKRWKDIQEARIADKGLKGELNPAMTIFTLKNVSMWRDKQEKEITHNFPQAIEITFTEPKKK